MDYTIQLDGVNYTLTTNDAAQIAAITEVRNKYNLALPEDKPKLTTDNEYLQMVFTGWKVGAPGFSEQDLYDCFARACASYAGQNPPEIIIQNPGPPSQAALLAYLDDKHTKVLNGGVTINNILVTTDLAGRTNLTGAYNLVQSGALQSINWVTNDGPVTLTAQQISGIATAVGVWVQDTYTLLGDKMLEIKNGTITTKEEIDAIVWPTIQ